ncbi:MAG: hypothetical protein PW792_17610 [Acidobacteriaceae bacterium]|nr:hypothetical protein [Acidobacteriaceae bacterium]
MAVNQVKQEKKGDEEFGFEFPSKPLRPAQCARYLRRTLAEHLPGILYGLVRGARDGSCQHVKLATELLQVAQMPGERREKGSAAKLLEELENEPT